MSDIKELRTEAANIIGLLTAEGHQSLTLDKVADFFEDVLKLAEEERYKGDLWYGKVTDLEGALKAERQRADDNSGECQKHASKVGYLKHALAAVEAELAALRGEQEPIGYLFDSHLKQLQNGEVVSLWPVAAFGETVEVFTRQTVPAVTLPAAFSQSAYGKYGLELSDAHGFSHGSIQMRRDIVKVLEAAGIVVKGGE